jgi:hypothetical protein
MNLIDRITRAFSGDVPADVIDFAPVNADESAQERYAAKLKRAADKYGKPFKCAANGLPREVMSQPGVYDALKPRGSLAQTPAQTPAQPTLKAVR